MKKSVLFILLGLATTFSACNKNKSLTACFEMSSTSINVGESIDFTSCSENELSLDWRITGPDSAIENSKGWSDALFTNTFNTPGSYTVVLKTFSGFSLLGNMETDSSTFTVN